MEGARKKPKKPLKLVRTQLTKTMADDQAIKNAE
jgi:hypothetical protein